MSMAMHEHLAREASHNNPVMLEHKSVHQVSDGSELAIDRRSGCTHQARTAHRHTRNRSQHRNNALA